MTTHVTMIRKAIRVQADRTRKLVHWWTCSCGQEGPDCLDERRAKSGAGVHRASAAVAP